MNNLSRKSKIMKLMDTIQVILVFILLLFVYCTEIINVPYHGDEADWIFSSSVFEPFIIGDRSSSI